MWLNFRTLLKLLIFNLLIYHAQHFEYATPFIFMKEYFNLFLCCDWHGKRITNQSRGNLSTSTIPPSFYLVNRV